MPSVPINVAVAETVHENGVTLHPFPDIDGIPRDDGVPVVDLLGDVFRADLFDDAGGSRTGGPRENINPRRLPIV